MTKFTLFADDVASMSIARLTIENGIDRIALCGSLDLTRDRQGLEHARALRRSSIRRDLPEALPAATAPRSVANPFS